ncbi:hypothetical protein [Tumebacillus lipolyticus]|uniref:Secreted protein n=1 Tax=Tumebacillus lipolyticus TaxID=1280370 RepID=A0ABW5A1V2_9BACL
MKKLLTAAVLSAMLMAPAAASAAPQDVNAVVAPEAYDQKFIWEYQTHYGTCQSAPVQFYHTTFDGYSGWLYKVSCYESGSFAYATYNGYVSKWI